MGKKILGLLLGIVVILWTWTVFGQTFEDIMNAGDSKRAAGKHDEALIDFRTALTLATTAEQKSQSQCRIGYTYFSQGKWADAINAFNAVTVMVGAHPSMVSSANLYTGISYAMESNLIQALIYYDKVINQVDAAQDNLFSAGLYKAKAYYQQGDRINMLNTCLFFLKKIPVEQFSYAEGYIQILKDASLTIAEWTQVLTDIKDPIYKESNFLFWLRAEAKLNTGDMTGAFSDINIAYAKTNDKNQISILGTIREKIKLVQ